MTAFPRTTRATNQLRPRPARTSSGNFVDLFSWQVHVYDFRTIQLELVRFRSNLCPSVFANIPEIMDGCSLCLPLGNQPKLSVLLRRLQPTRCLVARWSQSQRT